MWISGSRKKFFVLLGFLFVAGCSGLKPEAPASVAGRALEFHFANGEKISFSFPQGNVCTFPEIPAAYGNRVEYRKTSRRTAVLECEVWESIGTYTLRFTSPSGGEASYAGVIEGMKEEESSIPFLMK